jgi:hypothetical protein
MNGEDLDVWKEIKSNNVGVDEVFVLRIESGEKEGEMFNALCCCSCVFRE